jgi:glycerophosphoryl diester phosphodiesterase
MRQGIITMTLAALISLSTGLVTVIGQNDAEHRSLHDKHRKDQHESVQLGPRPYFLINDMDDSRLKRELLSCSEDPFKATDFTVGHRGGATLQFPEHTREAYEAGI